MNIIDIIAIIPYFITLATVVAEEEDTLNLPRAPVSPQVRLLFLIGTNKFHCKKKNNNTKHKLLFKLLNKFSLMQYQISNSIPKKTR